MIAAFLGIVVLMTIGAGTLTIVCSKVERWSLSAKLGLSFGLGMTILTISLFAASWLGLKPAWWIGVLETVFVWAAVAAFRRESIKHWIPTSWNCDILSMGRASRICGFALTSFVVLVCVMVGTVSLLEPLVEWDVVAIWAFKAKVFFYEPIGTTTYFSDITRAYSQVDYPLLLPLSMTWVWTWSGIPDMGVVKVLAPALLLAYATTFYGLLRRNHSATESLFFTAVLLCVPMLLSQTSRLSSDAMLGYFVLASFGCTYLWIETGDDDDLRVAGILSAGMLFTKKEGMALFAILVFTTLATALLRRKLSIFKPLVIWLVALPLALVSAWLVFRSGIQVVWVSEDTDVSGKLNPLTLLQDPSRATEVFYGILGCFVALEDWLALWLLLPLSLCIGAAHAVRRPVVFLLIALVLALIMYGYVFSIITLKVPFLMEYTMPRCLLHLTGLGVLLLAEICRVAHLLPQSIFAPRNSSCHDV